MLQKLKHLYHKLFINVSEDMDSDFMLYCANTNNVRFAILPLFNIITQISCYFIYLYIYPATFPEKQQLDPLFFTLFSLAYVLVNIVFCAAFGRQRKGAQKPGYVKSSHTLLLIFLLFYVLTESVETIMEVEISGNIYRFLATFFMVAFLPILRRREKLGLLLLFTAAVELGFLFIVGQGYSSNNRFQEIILLFFLVCVVVSNISYNSVIRTFALQHDLLAVNEKLRKANERLEHLAVIDPLTQISNRRAFDQYIALAWRTAYRDGKALTVVMADIDDFKNYNDTYGHQKGDDCLRAVASCISRIFSRETDMVARYGGEEFIMLMMPDDAQSVRPLVERMRESVQEMALQHENSPTGKVVTISVGFATAVPAELMRYEELIKQADDALYVAKGKGKNCSVSAEDPV